MRLVGYVTVTLFIYFLFIKKFVLKVQYNDLWSAVERPSNGSRIVAVSTAACMHNLCLVQPKGRQRQNPSANSRKYKKYRLYEDRGPWSQILSGPTFDALKCAI